MPQRPDTRAQGFLLPPSLEEWTPADHPVRFVDAFLASLPEETRQALGLATAPAGRGAPRYAPAVLVRVWVYGFMTGTRSARALERACTDQIPVRWLTGNQCPDHATLWRWYDAHRTAVRALLRQTVRIACHAGLLDLALLAVDGTKLRANAAADRSLTDEQLTALVVKTEAAIMDLEAQNVAGDEPPPTLPADLRTATALRARITAALSQCADRAAATGQARTVKAPRGNVTDPEARWMKTRRGIAPGYNAQAAVVPTNRRAETILGRRTSAGRFVVAAAVTTQPSDTAQLAAVLAEAIATLEVTPTLTVADAGYFDGAQLAAVADLGATVVVSESDETALTAPYHHTAFAFDQDADRLRCPAGHALIFLSTGTTRAGVPTRRYGGLGAVCRSCPAFGVCTTSARNGRIVTLTAHDAIIQAQRRTREFAAHRLARKRRKTLIEAVFGTIKTTLSGTQTLVRGRAKVEAEWFGLTMGLNLRTLDRIWRAMGEVDRAALLGRGAMG